MLLVDWQIEDAIKSGKIAIDGMREDAIGTNSVDLHLHDEILSFCSFLDATQKQTPTYVNVIDKHQGFTLFPNLLYLASTSEKITVAPDIHFAVEGKSSVGRLGISVHQTAGFGDGGFSGHITLEISVIVPVTIYAGMPIAQIYFNQTEIPRRAYNEKANANYMNQGATPRTSQLWKWFAKQ